MALRSQIEPAAELSADWPVVSQPPEQRATSSSFDTDVLWLMFLGVNLLAVARDGYSLCFQHSLPTVIPLSFKTVWFSEALLIFPISGSG